MPTKPVFLCADDFSLNPAINAGILQLIERERLAATSCMTQSPSWFEDAKALQAWRGKIQIGLHFNLTHPFPGSTSFSLPQLMLRCLAKLLDRKLVHNTLCEQLDRFEQAMGQAPDFIDGHQHVHCFPVIRDIVLAEYQRRYGGSSPKPWVRSLHQLPADETQLKARVLMGFAGRKFGLMLSERKIPHNNAFAGLYDFDPAANYAAHMQRWLRHSPEGTLIMCHPALENSSGDDIIAAARKAEMAYFSQTAAPVFKLALV